MPTFTTRDRDINRFIHRFFWRGSWQEPWSLIGCALTRFPAMFIYNVLIPFEVAYGIQAIVNRDFGLVNHYAWVIFYLAVAYVTLWGVGGVIISRNGRIGAQYIQREVVKNYLQKDYEFYGSSFLGALGAQAVRLRDAFNEYNQLMTINIPKQIIIIVTCVGIIAYQSLLLAAVTLGTMIAVLSFTVMTSRWRLRFRRRLSEASSELSGVIGDALGHGMTVKSFASEDYEQERLQKALGPWARIQYLTWVSSVPADTGRMLLAAGATSVLLVMTATMYRQGTISIAIVALVQMYVIKLVTATLDVAEIIKQYETTMGGAHQSVKTMLITPTVVDKPQLKMLPAKRNLPLAFHNVSFAYNDAKAGRQAICDFDLTIKPGEKVGFVGHSGSGKTTLTKLLLRFMDVTDGSITLGGLDLRDIAQKDLRNRIAYVPQEPLLFHRSVKENIAYGNPSASEKQIMAAAKAAYVDEFAEELAEGYTTIVGERGVKLSGGQRQRVAIARALLKDAPILVLDEATSALDSRSEVLIQEALWKLMEGRTAVVIAHRLSTIQRMDRIVVMEKGSIVQIGTHEELLKDTKGVYATLWKHQSGGYLGAAISKK